MHKQKYKRKHKVYMPRENERRKARALAKEKKIQSLCLRLCLCLRRDHFLRGNESSACVCAYAWACVASEDQAFEWATDGLFHTWRQTRLAQSFVLI